MADSEICGTKDPTFHRILLDTRFELPLGKFGERRTLTQSQENGQAWVGPYKPHLRTRFPLPRGEDFLGFSESAEVCTCCVRSTFQLLQVTRGKQILLDQWDGDMSCPGRSLVRDSASGVSWG